MKHFFILTSIFLLTLSNKNSFPYEKVIIFGDSLSDDGSGVYSLTGHYIPLPPYYEGRFSNGPIWFEYLSQIVHLNYNHDFTNYAYGGALVDSGVPSTVPSLMATVNDYLISQKFNISTCDAEKTLFILFGGGNDVRQAILSGALTNETMVQTLLEVLPYLINFITNRLIDAGGKNFIVIDIAALNVGPYVSISIPPSQLEKLRNLTLVLNDLIAGQVATLRSLGVNIKLYDPYNLWIDAVNHPENFGFRNSTGYCLQNYLDFIQGTATPGETAVMCKDPLDYLFWDGFGHPTTKFHETFANDFVEKMGWN